MKLMKHPEIPGQIIEVRDEAVAFYAPSGWQELSEQEVSDRAEQERNDLAAIEREMAEKAAAGRPENQPIPEAPEPESTEEEN
jgi:hypothetical protein